MRAFDLMIDGFSDVVKEPGPLGLFHIESELRRHDAAEEGHLQRMLIDILRKARPVFEPADQLHQLRVHSMDPHIKRRLLPGLPDRNLHLLFHFLDDLLDPGRMDPAVTDQTFQGDPGDLPPYRIKTGEDDRFRGIIDDEIDPRCRFKGADVPALPPDDPSPSSPHWAD